MARSKKANGAEAPMTTAQALGSLLNPMRVNIGSIGVLRNGADEAITSPDYVVFHCKPTLLPEYVYHYLKSEAGRHEINLKTKGSVRFRLYYEQLAQIKIPIPADVQDQQRFVDACNQLVQAKRRRCYRVRPKLSQCFHAFSPYWRRWLARFGTRGKLCAGAGRCVCAALVLPPQTSMLVIGHLTTD
jgi:hypothetical protein